MKNRTYRYIQKEVLYPFGFGLTYGAPVVADADISKGNVQETDLPVVTARISNGSDIPVEEVVQVYVKRVTTDDHNPNCTLKAFQRVRIGAGDSVTVEIPLDHKAFSTYSKTGDLIFDKGEHQIMIGLSSPFDRAVELGASKWKTISVVTE